VLGDDHREQDPCLGLCRAALDRFAKVLLGVDLIADGERILSSSETPPASDSGEDDDEGERDERTLRLEVEHRNVGRYIVERVRSQTPRARAVATAKMSHHGVLAP
jgi:hypothetical protein